MLRNPRYCGMVSYAGQHRVDPSVEWDGWSRVLFDDKGRPLLGVWDVIIKPKAWSQVQFELQLRRQTNLSVKADQAHFKPLEAAALSSGHSSSGVVKDVRRRRTPPPWNTRTLHRGFEVPDVEAGPGGPVRARSPPPAGGGVSRRWEGGPAAWGLRPYSEHLPTDSVGVHTCPKDPCPDEPHPQLHSRRGHPDALRHGRARARRHRGHRPQLDRGRDTRCTSEVHD